ncbi:jupiter microtubule associated homolog 1 [Anoplophora glabripennis]|nr:jupiter microtubule associated homolog 1 [Anoplophora glabripennis]
MANIYVGFHDQRSSSRVLKPPGGGSSDIFGTGPVKAKNEEIKSAPNTPSKNDVDTKNQINPEEKSDSDSVTNNKQVEQSNSEEIKIENLSINEENGEKLEDRPSETKATSKPDTISSIIRQDDQVEVQSPVIEPEKKTPQRVPPGGYSSGLW